jgi:hypothetical protein
MEFGAGQISTVRLIRILANAFEEQGWRNEGDLSLEIARQLASRGRPLTRKDLSAIPRAFYSRNRATAAQVLTTVNDAFSQATTPGSGPTGARH